ncbi:PTS galactitol transporter subunit IIB [Vibrio parahaemolyticus]|uniref:PTS galactitol transporter subunit IIB n=1 Tax=Vibrio parahaemolyticus TaxID=670 RepID=UPI0024BC26C4|nr:PTS galactitol transporter subunit IIB [Vibrio parahaemolyticus]WHT05044.1 PTS galactitol transporter subunit IIB [Vibrio parahaemolyticus]
MMYAKQIIVACGGAVATSTMAAEEIKDLCKEHGISVEIIQCRVSEIESNLNDDIALICTTSRLDQEFGDIPIFHGMPFISGVGIEKMKKDILDALS